MRKLGGRSYGDSMEGAYGRSVWKELEGMDGMDGRSGMEGMDGMDGMDGIPCKDTTFL